jgi:predicted XRE-type DNA-binding protein
MSQPDIATIHALRADIALQVARHFARSGVSQSVAAKQLDIPQPTLSKIVNGHVTALSIELLLRVAVRAGLPVTLVTGRVPQEAGVFLSNTAASPRTVPRSKLADAARSTLQRSQRELSPSQRLEAFLEHNQLISELQKSDLTATKPLHTRRTRT